MELKLNEFILSRIIENKSNDLISQEEVQDLTFKIDAYCKANSIASLSYQEFKHLEESLDKRYKKYFKPSVFLRLSNNRQLDFNRFTSYIIRKESLYEARLAFACYDSTYSHALTIPDLKGYMYDQIKDVPDYDELSPGLQDLYMQTCSKKLLLLLGTEHMKKIYIQDLLLSPILTEFLEVRENCDSSDKKWELSNFFAISSFTKLYNKFNQLDVSKQGSISANEAFKYGTYNMLFLERFCEEHGKNSRIDFEKFTELSLINDNTDNIHIVHLCFDALDVNKQGFLEHSEIRYLIEPVVKKLNMQLADKLDSDVVTNELMDALIVNNAVRKKDLKSKFGKVFLKILCTKNGLVEYYNSFASS
eukprot:NODE_50_length_27150_cov_0.307308.p5 type:complete len:362 gc:universal NODE_50_length_27150_cov_0.307308:21879-20794(-)